MPITDAQIEAAHAVLRERNCFVPWEDLTAALEAFEAVASFDRADAETAALRAHYLARREEGHLTWLRDRIAAGFGARCEEYVPGCCVCEAWALYDALAEDEAEMADEAEDD